MNFNLIIIKQYNIHIFLMNKISIFLEELYKNQKYIFKKKKREYNYVSFIII